MASGPAGAKNTTVATNVMKVDVIASGSRTPARRITHIMVGPAPDWNGVRYAAHALIPPAMIMSFSRTRSEEHTSELQSRVDLVCRLLLEKKKKKNKDISSN